MGQVTLPAGGSVYLDASAVIYSVERHSDYWPLMQPVWEAAAQGRISLVTSELTLLETLVVPLKTGDVSLVAAYESVLGEGDLRLLPIAQDVLREAARQRAATGLKTPDALHAATALVAGCGLLVTNDAAFRRVPALSIAVLRDLL